MSDEVMVQCVLTHLYVDIPALAVDPDAVKQSVCQAGGSGAEHIWLPVGMEVVPDLEAPWTTQIQNNTDITVLHFKIYFRCFYREGGGAGDTGYFEDFNCPQVVPE